jgi:hypothetical protein
MGERPTTISRTESEQQLKEKESKLFADDKAKEFTAKHQLFRIGDFQLPIEDRKSKIRYSLEGEEKPEQKAEQKADPPYLFFRGRGPGILTPDPRFSCPYWHNQTASLRSARTHSMAYGLVASSPAYPSTPGEGSP